MDKNNTFISAVILTKNEEKNIRKCIKNLYFCDEVVVIDDLSKDKTREIAFSLGAKVFERFMDKDVSGQSNYGMNKASGEWILFIDADERVSKKLAKEIEMMTRKCPSNIKGFYVKRYDIMWGKILTHGELSKIRLLRLVRKGSGYWNRRVHQSFIIKGKTGILKNYLLHYPHQSVSEFIFSVNRWSTWHSIANDEEGKISSVIKIFVWPILHFVKNYILKFGFIDGVRGLIFAALMSFHSFLAWGKLYVKQKE